MTKLDWEINIENLAASVAEAYGKETVKKRYSPVFSQHLWGGKHLVFDLYSCDIAPSSFG